MIKSTATLSNASIPGVIFFRRKLQKPDHSRNENSEQVGISAPDIQEQCKTLPDVCSFIMSADVSKTMGEVYTSALYV